MIDCNAVAKLMRQVAAEIVRPNWTPQGTRAQVWEKGPGDLVSAADRASEVAFTEALPKLLPGSRVVGEEAVSADPEVLRQLLGDEPVWIIDPIDGTWNYVHGKREYAIIVALVQSGRTLAGFILDPETDRIAMAGPGTPLELQGDRLALTSADTAEGVLGSLSDGYLPAELRRGDAPELAGLKLNREIRCAGHEYLHLLTGQSGYAGFNRTKPWDHVAGCFLVERAGGLARLADGHAYDARVSSGGLLVAANEALWHGVHDRVYTGRPVPAMTVLS